MLNVHKDSLAGAGSAAGPQAAHYFASGDEEGLAVEPSLTIHGTRHYSAVEAGGRAGNEYR
jgi:hypothetical protein